MSFTGTKILAQTGSALSLDIDGAARIERSMQWNVRAIVVFAAWHLYHATLMYLADSNPPSVRPELRRACLLFALALVLRVIESRAAQKWAYFLVFVTSAIVAGWLCWDLRGMWQDLVFAVFLLIFLILALRSCLTCSGMSVVTAIRRPGRPGGLYSYWSYLLSHGRYDVRSLTYLAGTAALWCAAYFAFGLFLTDPNFFTDDYLKRGGQTFTGIFIASVIGARELGARGAAYIARGCIDAERTSMQPESFCLLLRSFYDDFTEITVGGTFWTLIAGELSFALETQRFEAVITGYLFQYGPVFSIGAPGETSPGKAALRIGSTDENWRNDVKQLAKLASRVLLIISDTPGLRWEFNQSASLAARDKIVLLMPPDSPERRVKRWTAMTQDTADRAVPAELVTQTLLVRYMSDGTALHVVSRAFSPTAYGIALRMAFLDISQVEALANEEASRFCFQ